MSTWSFNGTDLSTIGVITVMDDGADTVDRRGGDLVIPYHDGEAPVSKYFSSRQMLFSITISSTTLSGLQTKIDALKRLTSSRTEKILSETLDDSTVRTGLASVNKSFSSKHESPFVVKCVVEFKMTDPLFRSTVATADNTTTINTSPKTMTVTNTGTVEERDPTITLTGPLENVVILNNTTGLSLTYTGEIFAAETVVIKTGAWREYTAYYGAANVMGNVDHSGSSAFMTFAVGVNDLTITSDISTTGTVRAEFFPPYL